MASFGNESGEKDYSDIIDLPHHVSTTHPQMARADRAAQFSPFAALTGYGAAIKETARTTDERPQMDEAYREELDEKLDYLRRMTCILHTGELDTTNHMHHNDEDAVSPPCFEAKTQWRESDFEKRGAHLEVTVTWFVPDEAKSGGRFATATGRLEKIDAYAGVIALSGGTVIKAEDVVALEGEVFEGMQD